MFYPILKYSPEKKIKVRVEGCLREVYDMQASCIIEENDRQYLNCKQVLFKLASSLNLSGTICHDACLCASVDNSDKILVPLSRLLVRLFQRVTFVRGY